jgi:hypothetical protein
MFRALVVHLQEALHESRIGDYCVQLVSGCGKSSHILRPTHIYNCTQYSPILRSCSASWRWVSNPRNMSRHWISIKCKWSWSVHQVGCVYYVITSLWCTVNKTLKMFIFSYEMSILLQLPKYMAQVSSVWVTIWYLHNFKPNSCLVVQASCKKCGYF